jgi:hypothetical protein
MKEDTVDGDHGGQDQQKLQKLTDIALGAFPLKKVADDGGVEFHDLPSFAVEQNFMSSIGKPGIFRGNCRMFCHARMLLSGIHDE